MIDDHNISLSESAEIYEADSSVQEEDDKEEEHRSPSRIQFSSPQIRAEFGQKCFHTRSDAILHF